MGVKYPLSYSLCFFICKVFTFITIPIVGDLTVCLLRVHQLSSRVVLPQSDSGEGHCWMWWEGQGKLPLLSRRAALRKPSKEF